MSEPDGVQLTDHDRAVVREAREEIAASPPPTGRGPIGWFFGLVGAALLVAWRGLVERVPGGAFLNPFILMAGALTLVGGPAYALFGGGSTSGAARAAVEAALRLLESGEGERDEILRAATLLISHAYFGDGAATVQVFRPEDVRGRIASAEPLVVAVERYLVDAFGDRPILTLALGVDDRPVA